jgi:hypothetical protein
VTGDCVGDLMPEDDGQPGGRLGHRQDTGVDRDLAARETEGVLLLGIVDHDEAPLVVGTVGHPGQPLPHLLDRRDHALARVHVALRQHLLVGLGAEFALFFRGHQDELRPVRVGGRHAADQDQHESHRHPLHGIRIAGDSTDGNCALLRAGCSRQGRTGLQPDPPA